MPTRHRDSGETRHRGTAQAPGLCHRPVRQEPPRRPEQVPADAHGFDEFFGNLYHLNAEEEPEAGLPNPRTFPSCAERCCPAACSSAGHEERQAHDRGHRTAHEEADGDDRRRDHRRGIDFIKRQHDAGTPFFIWINTTHMHFRTHTKKRSLGQAGRWQSPYHDTMIDHDNASARCSTSSTNSGSPTTPSSSTRPTTGRTRTPGPTPGPHRSAREEHNWEGAFRVPEMIRWPGKIQAGSVSNEIVSITIGFRRSLGRGRPRHHRALKGHKVGDMKYKVHIDGYNLLPYLTGEVDKSPRRTNLLLRRRRHSRASAPRTGRSSSRSSAAERCRLVRPFLTLRAPKCSTCGPTRTSSPTSPRTPTGTGSFTTPILVVPAQAYIVGSSSGPSRSTRRHSGRRASRSTR